LRHYDKTTAGFDRSSFQYVFVAGEPSYQDQVPSGLVSTWHKAKREVKISSLSGDAKAQEKRLQGWHNDANLLPPFKENQSGSVLNLTFDLAEATASQCRELAVRIWVLLGYETSLFNR